MREHGFENQVTPRVNARILDRYNAVNGLLRNSRNDVRLFLNPRCKYTIRDLERDVYKEGTQLRDDTTAEAKLRGHNADALGYIIHREFRIETAYGGYRTY
jgi:hypothetical protein